MRAAALAVPALLLLAGCGTARHAVSRTDTRDSVRVEVRIEKEYVRDTVTVEIPPVFVEREVSDTTSLITRENVSTLARVGKDGVLYHSLDIRPAKKDVEIFKRVERRDSSSVRTVYVKDTEVVKVPRELTWWQRTQIYGFWALAVLAALRLLLKRFVGL